MQVEAATMYENPSPEDLRKFTEEMPNCRISEYDNPNITARVTSRSSASTYGVGNEGDFSGQSMTREEYDRLAKMQDDYLREQDVIQIDGYIGNDPEFQTAARLTIEKANANIAGMQQKLFFPRENSDEPEVHVIYTPNLPVAGYPDERVIAVDLENNITRVFNSDYFGESKKGGLRMWNEIVYNRGGLSLHAGLKVIPTDKGEKVVMIIGLSGTGKTTTTFTLQNDSLPVQDDFVALMPDGRSYGTENGCFAKTFSLDEDFEPNIYRAVTQPTAYLENVSMADDGTVDFFDTNYTKNGRAVFGMSDLGRFRDAADVGKVDILLILNRNENIIPAVAKLTQAQAAAYFMLGETTGTSAGGASEEGKFLRVPGTNPFFPRPHALQGNRMLELLAKDPLEVYLMNTGRVGGKDGDERSKKVKIPHSSATVKGIAEGTITWTGDEDFGYEVATAIPDFDDEELLQPVKLYEREGRMDEYKVAVAQLKSDRVAHLSTFPELDSAIVDAVR